MGLGCTSDGLVVPKELDLWVADNSLRCVQRWGLALVEVLEIE
jgi:hypothetical protein